MRAWLAAGRVGPRELRAALVDVPPRERDAWVDRVLGLDAIPPDGPELPRGCVPYLPSSVDTLLRAIELADVRSGDVFVDVGSGVGRVITLVHLLTGADTIGVEIQPALVERSRATAAALNACGVSVLAGDAADLVGRVSAGSVFFLYCPFSGARLERVLDGLEPITRERVIRVCSVDLPLPARPWLTPLAISGDLAVYRSAR